MRRWLIIGGELAVLMLVVAIVWTTTRDDAAPNTSAATCQEHSR